MTVLFIEYPPCSTCKKAKAYLKGKGVNVVSRDIVNDTPSQQELALWIKQSQLELKKFFNSSGQSYRKGGFKEKLSTQSEETLIKALSDDGMLIKRPLVITKDQVLVGFKEEDYEKLLRAS